MAVTASLEEMETAVFSSVNLSILAGRARRREAVGQGNGQKRFFGNGNQRRCSSRDLAEPLQGMVQLIQGRELSC
ncbi:MAG: hypothetical protein ACOX2G_07035 [Bacillota bacterium]|jgi:hypothetical protein